MRHVLREWPVARAAFIRARMMLPRGGVRGGCGGVRYLVYHGVAPRDRGRFEQQLRALRNLGDFVGLSESLDILRAGCGTARHICLTFDDGRRDAMQNALPVLAAAGVPAAFFVVTDWIDAGWDAGLSWDDVRRLAAAGMTIGSHSVTHRRLSSLDPAVARAELIESRAQIEDALGQDCEHFAAPFGQPDDDYRRDRDPALARAAGYRSFFTTVSRGAVPGDDPWSLPRLRMEPRWGGAELRYAMWQ